MTNFKVDELLDNKLSILEYYRKRGIESLRDINQSWTASQFKKKSADINASVNSTRENIVEAVKQYYGEKPDSLSDRLKTILLVYYCSFVSMIELRNQIWEYEYMAFSRRVGEIWEQFCKTCFRYSVNSLQFFIPPLFEDVRNSMKKDINDYIDSLNLSPTNKDELKKYYEKVWSFVTSGEIKLELDLHFQQNSDFVNIDFKSGFGSNEKGNTNRLLLVATIYAALGDLYKCVLLVRSREEMNNHYFRTLRDSGIWNAYCENEAYDQIKIYTGFDIKDWIIENIDWESDLDTNTSDSLRKNNLLQYLKW